MKLTKMTERNMIDRKIVVGLLANKSQRTLASELRVSFRRIAKVGKLAPDAGNLDGCVPLPSFPEALFDEHVRAPSQPSDPEEKLFPHIACVGPCVRTLVECVLATHHGFVETRKVTGYTARASSGSLKRWHSPKLATASTLFSRRCSRVAFEFSTTRALFL